MLDFILKYWLEFLFGLIALGMTGFAKHYYSLVKENRKVQSQETKHEWMEETLAAIQELRSEFKTDIHARKEENKREDEEIATIRKGVLALWRKVFLEDGRVLLEDSHIITYDEFMDYTNEHDVYNALGGNHEGDSQFALVKAKYESRLKQDAK